MSGWNFVKEDEETRQRRAKEWAQNKQERLNELANTGQISIWSRLTSVIPDIANEVSLDLSEHDTASNKGMVDPEPRRDQAYEEAKRAALDSFKAKQQGKQVKGLPSKWHLLLKDGSY